MYRLITVLEEAATLCLNCKYPDGIKTKVPNTLGQRPKTFKIDFLNGSDAIEVKMEGCNNRW